MGLFNRVFGKDRSSGSSWKEMILRLDPEAKFKDPAKEDQITAVERTLGVALPAPLREILLESNGIYAALCQVIWPVSKIEDENQHMRTEESYRDLYKPFDNLLFFGDDGCGNMFAYSIEPGGKISKETIYMWDHETDEREIDSSDMRQFLEQMITAGEE